MDSALQEKIKSAHNLFNSDEIFFNSNILVNFNCKRIFRVIYIFEIINFGICLVKS